MLAPLGIKDARSGKWVRRGQRVKYADGDWWVWRDWRYCDNAAELLVQTQYKPQGYWQPCAPRYGGLVWVFPS